MMIVVLRSGVDLPPPSRGRGAPPRLATNVAGSLAVGESFLIPDGSFKHPTRVAGAWNQKYAPKKFAVRKTPDGVRAWRVA